MCVFVLAVHHFERFVELAAGGTRSARAPRGSAVGSLGYGADPRAATVSRVVNSRSVLRSDANSYGSGIPVQCA